jgi:hypothetical protein
MSVLLSIWTSTLARQKINTPPAQIEVAPDVQ